MIMRVACACDLSVTCPYNVAMYNPFEAFIGLRYVKVRRRNHFISFISLISISGIAIGVLALITVLSIMNGFEKELTARILGMASHATVIKKGGELTDWRHIAVALEQHPHISGVAPYLRAEGMLVNNRSVQGAVIRGVLPEEEAEVSQVAEKMLSGRFSDLRPGEYGMIIGIELARYLGVFAGDEVTLISPQSGASVTGVLPQLRRFTVTGIFEVGMNEFDGALALIHLHDALEMFHKTAPAGLRIKTSDVMRAPLISKQAMEAVPGDYEVIDWPRRHANLFKALKTEKTVMFIILSLIIAVAAFNIISTLIMVVTDKQADIAVLRTLGASPGSIMRIFIIQGTVIGFAGTVLGVMGGVCLALNVDAIISRIETFLQIKFMSPEVFYISELPSALHCSDVIAVALLSFILTVLATIYPARRAAQTQPAQALRYE